MGKNKVSRVCVTGGSGYIGCWLVKTLLEKGHTVHATLRNLEDESKVGLLKSLPNADTNLLLFDADIYNPNDFKPAIEGCEFVFHLATPMQHTSQSSQYKDTAEAAIAGVRSIADSCIQSQTVKRLIYTASILSMSPRNDDGVGFRPLLDESCWTPLDASSTYGNEFTLGYIKLKTLAEKAVLSYNDFGDSKLEVVTLPCGLVGGESLLSYLPLSVRVILAQLTGDMFSCDGLNLMQEFMGSVPLVHIDDVCRAHIFCMEQPSMKGRFCCAVACHSIKEIAIYFQETYPEYKIHKELIEGPEEGSKSDFSKLKKMGFEYKYGIKEILDDSVAWAKKLNGSSFSQAV
ncbi:PREDICTED: anthocyanidin reductase-like isoform X1 [Fragaria vesca subsp. vesca]|uniref:anthocyanidin reductase-like isoform X1 n=1 Tax=Fragaria vesca subsp. vesca TaxID=101020 RepID=UPI0002C33199|nr:PREDICTED: anthocyanidin reductase-like isoform X1 [Fragaria vesca subsp. vesca]